MHVLKLRFLDYFSKAKTEESGQQDWSVSDTFGITLDFFYKQIRILSRTWVA